MLPVKNSDTGAGIYLNLYRNVGISDTGTVRHGVYVGKTINFGKRKAQHDDNIHNPPLSGGVRHYKIAHQASAHKTVVLLAFPSWLQELSLNLKIAEHIFVSLLDTWNPLVLIPPADITQFCRRGSDTQFAIAFSTLARDTLQKIGWPPVTPFHGCNWKTPITEGEHFDPIPWTSMLIPDTAEYVPKNNPHGLPATRMRVFYRQPTKTIESIHRSASIKVQLFGTTENSPSITVTIPKATGITKGQTVQLVCEVMLDGTEHPFPWARFPDIGSFSGWKIVNTLGKLCYEESLRLG